MSWKRSSLLVLLAIAACGPQPEHGWGPYGKEQQALTVCADGGTVPGVDVSHLQGTIDWAQVAQAGRVFAVMKATEGLTFTDPQFATNWPQTKANGIYRAAYHFFRPQDDGVQQANAYLAVTGTDMTGDLPPMLDLEVTDNQTPAVILQRMGDWLTTVQAQTGKTPVIYTFPTFWSSTLGNPPGYTQYPLWIANYGVNCPDLPGQWMNWVIWQNSATDTVNGIAGSVDGDEFQGDIAALGAWANGTSPTDGGSTQDAGAADAGSPGRDAGATTDAGAPDSGSATDAGSSADAGQTADAGSNVEPDAGYTPDAGNGAEDGGTPARDAGPSSGSADAGSSRTLVAGGCNSSGGSAGWPFILTLLGALLARRRRQLG